MWTDLVSLTHWSKCIWQLMLYFFKKRKKTTFRRGRETRWLSERFCTRNRHTSHAGAEPVRVLALRRVDLDEVLQFGGVAGVRAAAVGFHVRVDAAVAENAPRGGQHRGVRARPPAQRAVPAAGGRGTRSSVERSSVVSVLIGRGVPAALLLLLLLLQVEWGRGCRQGGEGLHGALVVRGVPPLQELQEKDAQREGGGEGQGHAPRRLWHQAPRSLHQAANTRALHCGSGIWDLCLTGSYASTFSYLWDVRHSKW